MAGYFHGIAIPDGFKAKYGDRSLYARYKADHRYEVGKYFGGNQGANGEHFFFYREKLPPDESSPGK